MDYAISDKNHTFLTERLISKCNHISTPVAVYSVYVLLQYVNNVPYFFFICNLKIWIILPENFELVKSKWLVISIPSWLWVIARQTVLLIKINNLTLSYFTTSSFSRPLYYCHIHISLSYDAYRAGHLTMRVIYP